MCKDMEPGEIEQIDQDTTTLNWWQERIHVCMDAVDLFYNYVALAI